MPRQHQHPNQHESLASQLYKVPISPTGLKKKHGLSNWPTPRYQKKISRICRSYVSPIIRESRSRSPGRFTTWTCQRFITTCFRPSLSLEKSLEPLHCSVQSHDVMLRPWHGHHDPTDTAHRGTPSHQQRWRPSQRSNLESKSNTKMDRLYQGSTFLRLWLNISCFIDLHCWLIVYGIVNLNWRSALFQLRRTSFHLPCLYQEPATGHGSCCTRD